MPENLELRVDKFTFRVATDRAYSREGLWVLVEGSRVRIGLTDFLQQRSGDVAFAKIKPVGTPLTVGDEVAAIETIKVNVIVPTPIGGKIVEVNPVMATTPEIINQDPYGRGWLAIIEADAWNKDRSALLGPQAYLEIMRREAEEEASKP